MSSFKTEEFFNYLDIKLIDFFENDCYSANKLFVTFVSIIAEVLEFLCLREMQLEKKNSSNLNPGFHLACLNLFTPKQNVLTLV